jgi:hypothetical protein
MDGVWDGTLIPCIISAGVRTRRVKDLNYEYVDKCISSVSELGVFKHQQNSTLGCQNKVV